MKQHNGKFEVVPGHEFSEVEIPTKSPVKNHNIAVREYRVGARNIGVM